MNTQQLELTIKALQVYAEEELEQKNFAYTRINPNWERVEEHDRNMIAALDLIKDLQADDDDDDDSPTFTPPDTTKTIDGITIDTWILDDEDTNIIHEIYAEPEEQLSYAIYLIKERATDHRTPAEWTAKEHPEEFSIEVTRYSNA